MKVVRSDFPRGELMLKKVALPRLTAGLTLALVLALSSTLFAIHPTITASAACDNATGKYFITYTAARGPFDDPNLSNPSVNILFDGNVVDNGAWTPPTQSFSDTVAAPADAVAGDTVVVSLLVVGNWSNGGSPGQTASTEVVLPGGCTPPVVRGGCTPG